MKHYVEIQFGRYSARVNALGDWTLVTETPLDSGQTRELLEMLEDASSSLDSGYAPNRAVRFADAAIANLLFDAEITANTMPTDPLVPNVIY